MQTMLNACDMTEYHGRSFINGKRRCYQVEQQERTATFRDLLLET